MSLFAFQRIARCTLHDSTDRVSNIRVWFIYQTIQLYANNVARALTKRKKERDIYGAHMINMIFES